MGFNIKRIARKSIEWKWRWNLCLKNSQNIQRKFKGKGSSFSVKNQGRYSWDLCERDFHCTVLTYFFQKWGNTYILQVNWFHQNHLSCINSSFSKWKADSQKTQSNATNRSFHYKKFSQFWCFSLCKLQIIYDQIAVTAPISIEMNQFTSWRSSSWFLDF